MAQYPTFRQIFDRYGFGDKCACPLAYLLLQSSENRSIPLALSEGTAPEFLQQRPHFRKYDNRATTVGRIFPTLFEGYNEVDCNGAVNIGLMDSNTKLNVGGAATIDGILKVMYLCPEYLEYNRYGLGWFGTRQSPPTDTFDITVRHAKAILAAGQTQLDDIEYLKPATGPEHEVSYSRSCYRSF